MYRKKNYQNHLFNIFLTLILTLFFSCVSPYRQPQSRCSRNLLAQGIKSDRQLAEFFLTENNDISLLEVQHLANLYIKESSIEGINSDVAFVQMCLETGFLRYGNLVKKEWHNYCGLGAEGPEKRGEIFETEEIGVRAHIQHLHAYATTVDVQLKQTLVDPRYSWPHKAKYAQTIFELALSWAMDKEYGNKLDALLTKLEQF